MLGVLAIVLFTAVLFGLLIADSLHRERPPASRTVDKPRSPYPDERTYYLCEHDPETVETRTYGR
jgi:hypothetical protein